MKKLFLLGLLAATLLLAGCTNLPNTGGLPNAEEEPAATNAENGFTTPTPAPVVTPLVAVNRSEFNESIRSYETFVQDCSSLDTLVTKNIVSKACPSFGSISIDKAAIRSYLDREEICRIDFNGDNSANLLIILFRFHSLSAGSEEYAKWLNEDETNPVFPLESVAESNEFGEKSYSTLSKSGFVEIKFLKGNYLLDLRFTPNSLTQECKNKLIKEAASALNEKIA